MTTASLGPFRGIDTRPGAADEPGGMLLAKNLIVDSERRLVRRPALDFRIALPADSVGLYSVGDQLHTLAPYHTGDETADDVLMPTVQVDYFTDQNDTVELVGQLSDSDGRTMALLRLSGGGTQMHHCPAPGEAPASSTLRTDLGFTPDFALMRASGRAWTMDANLRYVRYSAVDSAHPEYLDIWQNTSNANLGPLNSDNDGPGFLQVAQFAAGSGRPQALGLFGGKLVVFYQGSLLVYNIDVDQSRFYQSTIINGPGTMHPHSVVDMESDTIFLSNAGVRVLSTVAQSLDARADAIGGRIDNLAKQLASPVGVNPIGHYARRLGCYLLAFGTEVLCLAVLPGSGVLGWTTWTLPVEVDAIAEQGGLVWIRSGNNLYALDDAQDDDEVSLATFQSIPVLAETLPRRFIDGAMVRSVAAVSPEDVRVQVVADARPSLDIHGAPMGLPMTLAGRAPESTRAVVGKWGRTLSIRVFDAAAHAGWRLDELWWDVSARRSA